MTGTLREPLKGPVIRPDWLLRPQTKTLFDVLGEENLRAVGGCVRDSLHRKTESDNPRASAVGSDVDSDVDIDIDIDMATKLVPEAVMEHLTSAGIKVIPTGLKYGTVTAVLDGLHYEITSLRQDVETDGRHACVVYGEDWAADARRRDFTMNALYCDASGCVYDPLGQGLADLQAEKVVFIGDAEARIHEDYLRVLRFFRFHALIGDGAPDILALKACRKAARDGAGLKRLSGERLQQELFKMLAIENPVWALMAMHEAGVLAFVVPVSKIEIGLARLERLVAYDSYVTTRDPVVRLASLLAHAPQDIKKVTRHLRLSNRDKDRLIDLLSGPYHDQLILPENRYKFAYFLGRDLCADLFVHQQSADAKTPDIAALKAQVKEIKNLRFPAFPVTGKVLMEAGFEPGPEMGHWLKVLEKWWVDNGFTGDEQTLMERLRVMRDLPERN